MTLIYETTARHGRVVRIFLVEKSDVQITRAPHAGLSGPVVYVSKGIPVKLADHFPLMVVRVRVEGPRPARGGRRMSNYGTGIVKRAGWQTIHIMPVANWPRSTTLSFGRSLDRPAIPYVELSAMQVEQVMAALDYFWEHRKPWTQPKGKKGRAA